MSNLKCKILGCKLDKYYNGCSFSSCERKGCYRNDFYYSSKLKPLKPVYYKLMKRIKKLYFLDIFNGCKLCR